ncbi:hypothetical cytosolic protein [Syntrophus aciditrophicus SB]|nr:hypothetical cytosolic protein [Syntrophus aciditrophicus SB]
MGGDWPGNHFSALLSSFNPRPRMGGDDDSAEEIATVLVSIHAPAWGATRISGHVRGLHRSFNPRPRMGGDIEPACNQTGSKVSIHAPAWGATLSSLFPRRCVLVSIHAPAWGATIRNRRVDDMIQFQSTPPHGGRLLIPLIVS